MRVADYHRKQNPDKLYCVWTIASAGTFKFNSLYLYSANSKQMPCKDTLNKLNQFSISQMIYYPLIQYILSLSCNPSCCRICSTFHTRCTIEEQVTSHFQNFDISNEVSLLVIHMLISHSRFERQLHVQSIHQQLRQQ